jgi:hypothetical protein
MLIFILLILHTAQAGVLRLVVGAYPFDGGGYGAIRISRGALGHGTLAYHNR